MKEVLDLMASTGVYSAWTGGKKTGGIYLFTGTDVEIKDTFWSMGQPASLDGCVVLAATGGLFVSDCESENYSVCKVSP